MNCLFHLILIAFLLNSCGPEDDSACVDPDCSLSEDSKKTEELPQSFQIISIEANLEKVTLTWEESKLAQSYIVRYGTKTGEYATVASESATSPFEVSGLQPGFTYYFMVTATNQSGLTDANAEVKISISAEEKKYTIGGTLTGLSGEMRLQVNGINDLDLSENGEFVFPEPLKAGVEYEVTINKLPEFETCTLENAKGTVSANVTNVAVACAATTFPVSYFVTGLNGTLSVTNNGGDVMNVQQDAKFTFDTQVAYGSTYEVLVSSQPEGQKCTVANGAGTVQGVVESVTISCETSFKLSGTMSGLVSGETIIVENQVEHNGAKERVTITENGKFEFSDVPNGGEYNLQIVGGVGSAKDNCVFTSATSGTLNADVTNLAIGCP